MSMNEERLWPGLVILVWIWAFALAVYTGWPRLWGLVPLGPERGLWAPVAALLLTGVLLGLGAKAFDRFLKRMEKISAPPSGRLTSLLGALFFCLVLFLLAWTFRSRNHFLGDGWAMAKNVGGPFYFFANEPLDVFLHQLFYRFLELFGITSGETAYALPHCLLFPVFVWICWRIAGLVSAAFSDRAVLLVLMISTASLQHFFGYVESYTLLHLCVAAYLYLGLRYLHAREGKRFPWAPALLYLLAAANHRSGVVLGPSLLYLWFARAGQRKSSPWWTSPSLKTLALSLLAFVFLMAFSNREALVPLTASAVTSDRPYRLYDLSHLWDKLNFLLLVCSSAVAALPVLAARWRRLYQRTGYSYGFVLWAAAGTAFFLLVLNPLVGVRDWDLFSVPALPLALACGWGLLVALEKGPRRDAFLRALALAAAVHAAAWVWVNADSQRGVRFLDRARTADWHRGAGKIQLGYLLFERDLTKEALNQYRMAEGEWSASGMIDMGKCFIQLNQPDSLVYYYQELVDKYKIHDPVKSKFVYMQLSNAYEFINQPEQANEVFFRLRRNGLKLDPDEILQWANTLEKIAANRNLDPQGVSDYHAALFLLRYCTLKQDAEMLKTVCESILSTKLEPAEWAGLLEFAKVCGQTEYLRAMLEKALQQHPDNQILLDFEK